VTTTDARRIPIIGFNRVELIVREDEIHRAIEQFNEALGLDLPAPHPIQQAPVLSSTDFDGGLELVAPVDGQGSFGAKLATNGAGQIGPLVWEVADVEQAREWLDANGYRIRFEYDSRIGNRAEAAAALLQLVLDPEQWFGFSVTLMQRFGRAPQTDRRDANKTLATRFCELYTRAAWDELAALLDDEFRWIVPTSQNRQSPHLVGAPRLNESPGWTKAETVEIFRQTQQTVQDGRFDLTPVSFTAEGDRVAFEAVGHAVNKANGRIYDNRYHHLMTFREDRIIELREYQDTLLLYDVWMAP
jgi:ketosteroid isomerase-like protein